MLQNDGSNLNSFSHLLLPVQERLAVTQQQGCLKKSGHWCAAHVRIAWEIHLVQQHQRHEQTQVGLQRLCASASTAENDRLNDYHQPSLSSGEVNVNGHLDPLYRLGIPLFGRLPFPSSSRIQLNNFPFGGSFGSFMHRLTASHETPPGDESGFAAADWLRLGKSSLLYSAPPPPPPPPSFWLSSEAEKKRGEEDERRKQRSQESNERLRERNSDSCRSSGSSRNERPRSRSPVTLPRSRPSLLSRDSGGSPSHRAYSSSSSSSSTSSSTGGSARRARRSRTPHGRPPDPGFPVPAVAADGRNNDDYSSLPSLRPTPPPPCPDDSNTLLATGPIFLHRPPPPPFLWSDPLRMDADHLRRLLGGCCGGASDDPEGALARLTHLDLMLRKSSLALVPAAAAAGLGPPFRHLAASSPGLHGKAGIQSYFGTMPTTRYHRAQNIDSSASPAMYKIAVNGHHHS